MLNYFTIDHQYIINSDIIEKDVRKVIINTKSYVNKYIKNVSGF